MAETEIGYNLLSYVDRIEKEIALGNFRITRTEDFFLRILSATYKLENLENLAYDKINTIAIDLIDRTKSLGVQITAQKSNEKAKIDDTISDTIKVWKDKGVKILWILFISETPYIKKNIDTTIQYCEQDGIKVYIKTVRRIIGDIEKVNIEERIKIDELIKQETSPEYYGLSKLTLFSPIGKGQKITNDNFFNLVDSIYYSKKEFQTIKYLANDFSSGRLKEYCILGNPCSGKTTFAYSIIQNINRNKIFYINLSNPTIQANLVADELVQISHNHSFVVIDNIHDNIDLFRNIRDRVSKHKWIKALYLSRYYKTFDEFDNENIYKILDGIHFFRIDSNENFEEKVSGIIWKKTKLLRAKDNTLEWRKGNFQKILRNINSNLLKLNIALRMWELKNSKSDPLTFDTIDSNKILQQFYEEHNLHSIKNDILYTYCLLFKNDVPFITMRSAVEENKELKEKGIVLQYFKSDFCFFPHKEYAHLIYDSFVYIDNGIEQEKKTKLILNYIHNFDTYENNLDLILLLNKFYYSDDKEIVADLLNDKKVKELLTKQLNFFHVRNYGVTSILNIVFQQSENISKDHLLDFFDSFILFFKSKKLYLFIYEHYMIYTRLLQLSNLLNIEIYKAEICVISRKNEIANTNSVVELTLRISKKNRTPETVLRILNTFTFADWLEMINGLPKLTNISNSLSELNTSTEAKKLLAGLVRNINWDSKFNSAKSLKIDQFAKSLREIQKIDTSVGTSVSRKLFYDGLKEVFILEKLKSANLSEYSKALSDFSKIDSNFVKTQLEKDLQNNKLKDKFTQEPSLSNFTARALELKKHFDDSVMFFEQLNHIATSDIFLERIENEKNLNYLLIFAEFASNFLNFNENELSQTTTKAITNIVKNLPDKFTALNNPKFLNIESLDAEFIDSITSSDLEKFFKVNKITYADNLFRVLSRLDKVKTIRIFKDVKNDIIVNALLNTEINFSQSLEYLNKLRKKVYKNEAINSTQKISVIFDNYLRKYKSAERRYYKLSVSDFLKGYYFGYCIDKTIIEKHCLVDLNNKLKSNKHRSFEISPLFQFIRRISEMTNNSIDKELEDFLIINTSTFIETIRNEEIIKTLSGLCELGLSPFKLYADELLFKCKGTIIKKCKQRKNDEIYKVKLIPDLEKIAINKGKIVLKELK